MKRTIISALLFCSTLTQTSSAVLMWNAERDGKNIAILAGIPLPETQAVLLDTPPVTRAINAADVVVLERQMDPDLQAEEQRQIVREAMYEPGDNLMRNLPDDVAGAFNQLCQKYQFDSGGIVRVRPWAAGYKINRIALKRAGIEDPDMMAMHVFSTAARLGKPVDYLSNPDELLSIYNGLTTQLDVDCFKWSLTEAARKGSQLRTAAAAWTSGDAAAAETLVETSLEPYAAMRTAVMGSFNTHWAQKLAGMTRFDDHVLVVVPLEYMFGTDGLLEKLRAQGFSITTAPVE